ncbi:MAG TPA: TIGR04086 family membrane protein [Firmicutes bacterium]|nr:TIGR04086 family membrane protein [Bacillota bacterium]
MRPPGDVSRAAGLGPVVLGAVLGFSWTLVVAGLAAFALFFTPLNEAVLGPILSVAAVAASFVAGFGAGRKSTEYGWLNGAAAGLLYVLICVALGQALYRARLPVSFVVLRMVMGLAGGIIGGVVGINTK